MASIDEIFEAYYSAKGMVKDVVERSSVDKCPNYVIIDRAADELTKLGFMLEKISGDERILYRLKRLVREAIFELKNASKAAQRGDCAIAYSSAQRALANLDSMEPLLTMLAEEAGAGHRWRIHGPWFAILALLGLGLAAVVLKKL